MLPEPSSYSEIVERYRADHQERAGRELRLFALQKSLSSAIRCAGLAQSPASKRFEHQRRVPRIALEASAARLAESEPILAAASTFEELHEAIEALVGPIAGIGELTIYDTSLRIGAFLKLEPARVFLHAGTRVGASYLGFGPDRKSLHPTELPAPFQTLRPHEIEDCLCIYKNALRQIASNAAA